MGSLCLNYESTGYRPILVHENLSSGGRAWKAFEHCKIVEMEDNMKYKELLEPHQTLLFQLVEVYREHAVSSSGVIPFFDELGVGLVLYPSGGDAELRLKRYTLANLSVLEKEGHIDCLVPEGYMPGIALTPQALDYYDYMHSPPWRRRISDAWDKTEKYWLALLFGLLGGFLGGWCAWLSRNWLWQK